MAAAVLVQQLVPPERNASKISALQIKQANTTLLLSTLEWRPVVVQLGMRQI